MNSNFANMKSDLEELIDAYQEEKIQLEMQIQDYVEEGDYLYAHFHNKALKILNKTLEVLKTLHNPVHRDILDEEMRIKGCNKMLASPHYSGSNDFLKTYMEKSLRQTIIESEQKIRELKNTETQSHYDSQELDEALFSLVNDDIKRFTLYLKSAYDVTIEFEINDNAIEIRLALNDEDDMWKKKKIDQLLHTGFRLQGDEYIYQYLLNRFKDSLDIKMMLSHLIYDVFSYDSRYHVAELVYH
jgi:hypothetical protein